MQILLCGSNVPPNFVTSWKQAELRSSIEFSVLEYHLKLQAGSNIKRHKSIWQDSHNSIYVDEMTSFQSQAEWSGVKYFMQKFLVQ